MPSGLHAAQQALERTPKMLLKLWFTFAYAASVILKQERGRNHNMGLYIIT